MAAGVAQLILGVVAVCETVICEETPVELLKVEELFASGV
jgi:hypothetical protein